MTAGARASSGSNNGAPLELRPTRAKLDKTTIKSPAVLLRKSSKQPTIATKSANFTCAPSQGLPRKPNIALSFSTMIAPGRDMTWKAITQGIMDR